MKKQEVFRIIDRWFKQLKGGTYYDSICDIDSDTDMKELDDNDIKKLKEMLSSKPSLNSRTIQSADPIYPNFKKHLKDDVIPKVIEHLEKNAD